MRVLILSSVMFLVFMISQLVIAEPTTMPAAKPVTIEEGASCKLSPAELAKRRQELIPGLFKRAEKVEDIDNGLRFQFKSKPGLLADLAKIMEQEQDCCSFLRIQLTMEASEGGVTFEVTGPKGTGEMLRKL
jgi:hypothetical protein